MTTSIWPLHPAQQGLLEAKARNRAEGANCAFAYLVTGAMDPGRLIMSYRRAVADFDALRLRLVSGGHSPMWRIGDEPRIALRLHAAPVSRPAISGFDDARAQATSAARQYAAGRFDPAAGPLGSVDVMQISDAEWMVVEAIDHIVADGRALALLHEAVTRHYASVTAPGPAYGRYTGLITAMAGREIRDKSAGFWRAWYQGFEPARLLPDPAAAIAATQREVRFDAAHVADIEHAAGRHRATLAAALFAAYAHAVARHTGHGDVAVFTAIDGRDADAADVFGQATSLVPIRVAHQWSQHLDAHLSAVTRRLLAVREHLAIDIHDLDRYGAPVTVTASDATAFIFQDRPAQPPCLPGLALQAVDLPNLHNAGGLTAVLHRQPDGAINLRIRTPTGSALHAHTDSIAATVETFANVIVSGPDCRVGDDALLPRQMVTLIRELSEPEAPYPFVPIERAILHRLRGAARTVVIEDGRTRSSRELRAAVIHRIAALRSGGVAPRQAVLVDDSSAFDRIASFLAVLQFGAVYVPIDFTAPTALRTEIERRSGAVARLTADGLHRLCTPENSQAERHQRPPAGPNDPAYIIFTSGTTGQPKGVVIPRAALSNLAQGEGARFGIGPRSRVLLIAPPSTDPWICHVTGGLAAGATLVAAAVLSDTPLAEQLEREQVSHAFLPASLFAQLEPRPYPHLEMIATAGDQCRPTAIRHFLTRRVFNIYGPTEATVTATAARVTQAAAPVPIGRPIRGAGARVLIDEAASAPLGVPGELMLSGAGLAIGYLDDEVMTYERFRPDPLQPGRRIYATGDRAQLSDDGQLYVSGRIDRQVKIRGFRVELGHLETAARTTGLCGDAYAVAVPASGEQRPDKHLVLFAEGCTRADELAAQLRTTLPSYLRPRSVVVVDHLPRHPSGKIDEARLPSVKATDRTDGGTDSSAPYGALGPVAALLAPAWRRVLGAGPQPADDFFVLGGDSLDVLRLVREARAAGVPLAPADVYQHSQFADLLANLRNGGVTAAGAGEQADLVPLGPSQRWFFGLDLTEPNRWNQQHWITFARLPEHDALEAALTALLRATPILSARVSADGIRYQPTPATQFGLTIIDAPPDVAVTRLLHSLHAGIDIDPENGILFRAAALRTPDGSGTLILVAHHLVVDDWSWQVIEDRLCCVLAAARPGPVRLRTDNGFAQFTSSVARQAATGAFALDASAWAQILRSGRTADATQRPGMTERALAVLRGDPRALAAAWGEPLPAVLLGCLAHALAVSEPADATVIDLERNGRTVLPGLDLSEAVGWFALHHPVRLTHAPLGPASVARLAASMNAAPDMGLSYGAAASAPNNRCGRFAVNISESGPPSSYERKPVADQLRRCAVSATGENHLAYEGAFVFRLSPAAVRVELTFDPSRLSRETAAILLDAAAGAPERWASSPLPGTDAWPDPFEAAIPASFMQQLMLEAAHYGPGIYRPRQVLALDGLSGDSDAFLAALGSLLGRLDPFRRRFRRGAAGIQQQRGPAGAVVIRRRRGGEAVALQWTREPDAIDAEAAVNGAPLADLVAFEAPGEPLRIGMQVHHAIIDGPSNRRLLALIEDLIARHAAGLPTMTASQNETSAAAVRKHTSAELALTPAPGPADRDCAMGTQARLATCISAPEIEEEILAAPEVARLEIWARSRAVDLRAVFAAAALALAYRQAHGQSVYLVSNGRDPDIPETEEALGMFWYFQPVTPETDALAELAAHVFALAGRPTGAVRTAAAEWRTWLGNIGGLSFSFLKSAPVRPETARVHTVAHIDLFHFRTHVETMMLADGSARIRLSTGPGQDGRREPLRPLLSAYLRTLQQTHPY